MKDFEGNFSPHLCPLSSLSTPSYALIVPSLCCSHTLTRTVSKTLLSLHFTMVLITPLLALLYTIWSEWSPSQLCSCSCKVSHRAYSQTKCSSTFYSSTLLLLFSSLFHFLFRLFSHISFIAGGRFDHADRLFGSIAQTWHSCLTSTADVKVSNSPWPCLCGSPPSLLPSTRTTFSPSCLHLLKPFFLYLGTCSRILLPARVPSEPQQVCFGHKAKRCARK